MGMLVMVLAAAVEASVGAPAAYPSSAVSCQLQAFQGGQNRIDMKGEFAPFIVRFDEVSPATAPSVAERFSIYDPQNLLRSAKPLRVHLLKTSVAVTTDVDGPAGILDFSATNFDQVPGPNGPVRVKKGNWVGAITMIGGSTYRAVGPCYYSRDASLLDDETLIIQKAK